MKKSVPFPKLSLQRRRRLIALGSSRERMLRKHKKRDKTIVESSSKIQGIREARYRKARKLLKNAIAQVKKFLNFLSVQYFKIEFSLNKKKVELKESNVKKNFIILKFNIFVTWFEKSVSEKQFKNVIKPVACIDSFMSFIPVTFLSKLSIFSIFIYFIN